MKQTTAYFVLAEHQFILEKIDNSQIRSKCSFPTKLEVSRNKWSKQSRAITRTTFCRPTSKHTLKSDLSTFYLTIYKSSFYLQNPGLKIVLKLPVIKGCAAQNDCTKNSGIWRPVLVKILHLVFICACWSNYFCCTSKIFCLTASSHF